MNARTSDNRPRGESQAVRYFAYGSNLDEAQMKRRCPSARAPARAILHNHVLVFGGYSGAWGGPVANVEPARGAQVEGLTYLIDRAEIDVLDRYEGHPYVYRRTQRVVTSETDQRWRAAVYIQPERRAPMGRPPARYLATILRAYQCHGFDLQSLLQAARATRAPRTGR